MSETTIRCVDDPAAGAVLFHPLRLRVLEESAQPASATEIAGRLGESRQKVNYHVKTLAEAGFLRPEREVRRGNLLEQRYVATARSFLLTPGLLGAMGADQLAGSGGEKTGAEDPGDSASADHLLALTARAQEEIAEARRQAGDEGARIATLSMAVDVGFESAAQRAAFATALRDAVTDVVGRFSAPLAGAGESDARSGDGGEVRPFRLLVGCHPIPAATTGPSTPAAPDTPDLPEEPRDAP